MAPAAQQKSKILIAEIPRSRSIVGAQRAAAVLPMDAATYITLAIVLVTTGSARRSDSLLSTWVLGI
jgi:hypothetical protein